MSLPDFHLNIHFATISFKLERERERERECAEQNLKALPDTIHEHIHADVHQTYAHRNSLHRFVKRRKKEDEC